MTQPTIFDSRSPAHKTPFGAVPCGTKITLTLRPPQAEGFVSAVLLLHLEFAGEHREVPLSPAGTDGDRDLFTAVYTAPAQPELIWYTFRLTRRDGGQLLLDRGGAPWQQTVYDGALPTPDWFGRGVTYQIFPDRFRRTRVPDPAGLLGNRVVHQTWDEPMDYRPDPDGEIRSRDFFGGDLPGITEKLDYLAGLGVTTLYLCPIFESASNHRYNTADYERVDPMLGTEADFSRLCARAKELGIHVMLDGVFNHTGSNSRYFNAEGAYPAPGAAQSQDSPYFPWYTFQRWPDQYDSWWGIRTLPAVNEMHPGYLDYIIEGKDSIIRRWLRLGADAWRLDVADELPDAFIGSIRRVMDEEKPGSFLLGEVWEDGSNKISYGRRRRYLLGRETHGLMNYPFRVGALAYLQGGGAEHFLEAMETIRENYPPAAFFSSMNMLGTHDTPRILTLLGVSPQEAPADKEARADFRMTPEQYRRGVRLLLAGAVLLYAFPGSPTVFYGDEAGMEGWEDPFNRGTYPWGQENQELLERFILLGSLRRKRISLQIGALRWLHAQGPLLAFTRETEDEVTAAAVNSGDQACALTIPWSAPLARDLLTGQEFVAAGGSLRLTLPPTGALLLSTGQA